MKESYLIPGETRNCHEYCHYAQACNMMLHGHPGTIGMNPEECAAYYKIEDILWDAECARRDYQDEDEIPFDEEPDEDDFTEEDLE